MSTYLGKIPWFTTLKMNSHEFALFSPFWLDIFGSCTTCMFDPSNKTNVHLIKKTLQHMVINFYSWTTSFQLVFAPFLDRHTIRRHILHTLHSILPVRQGSQFERNQSLLGFHSLTLLLACFIFYQMAYTLCQNQWNQWI